MAEPIYSKPLTDAQIDTMLGFLNEIRFFSPIPESNVAIRLNHYLILSRQIENVLLADSPEARKMFGELLERQFYRSMEEPKSVEGINTATIVGEAMTQLQLKLKGQVGTKGAQQSQNLMDKANKLLGPSNSFKDQESFIYFEHRDFKPISFQDAFSEIPRIVDTIVGDLVESNNDDFAVDNDWMQVFKLVYPDRHTHPVPPEGQTILRLSLRKVDLVIRNLLPADVAKMIRSDSYLLTLGTKVVWSPLMNAELWVWTDDNNLDYLEARILKPILKLSTGGVKNLTKPEPTVIPFATWIERERQVGRNKYKIVLSHTATMYPWTLEQFKEVLKRIPGGIEIVKYKVKYLNLLPEFYPESIKTDRRYGVHVLTVTTDPDAEGRGRSPRMLLTAAEKQLATFDITRLAYLNTGGSNLADLLSLPGINNQFTCSTALRDVAEVLGIEASWRMFVVQFMELFGNLLPQHAMLLANFMHAPGVVASFNYTGQAEQGRSTFGAASQERSTETVIRGAPYNVETRDINVKLALGQEPELGTGDVSILTPKDIIETILQNQDTINRGSEPYAQTPNVTMENEMEAGQLFAGMGATFASVPKPSLPPLRREEKSALPSRVPPPYVAEKPSIPNISETSSYLPTQINLVVPRSSVSRVGFSPEPPNGAIPPNFRLTNDTSLPPDMGVNRSSFPPQRTTEAVSLYSRPAIVSVGTSLPPRPTASGVAAVLAARTPRTNVGRRK
jgi:hypothetical protein